MIGSRLLFLGKTDHSDYLKCYRKLYIHSLSSDKAIFQDVDNPIWTGYLYTLNDKNFEEIDFYSEVGPIFTNIIVPRVPEVMIYKKLDEQS